MKEWLEPASEIRAILAHQRLPDLSGTVSRQDAFFNNASDGLFSGVTVHLTSVKGDAYTAVTDYDGIYTVLNLAVVGYLVVRIHKERSELI